MTDYREKIDKKNNIVIRKAEKEMSLGKSEGEALKSAEARVERKIFNKKPKKSKKSFYSSAKNATAELDATTSRDRGNSL